MATLRNSLVAIFGALCCLFVAFIALMGWGSRVPSRPSDISSAGVFIERGVVPFKLSTHGDWLDCWQDRRTSGDHCRLTDEKGRVRFEDTFLAYEGQASVQEADLKIDPKKTGHLFMGVTANNVPLPIIFLQNGEILLPQSEYERAKKVVDFWVNGHGNG